MISGMYMGEIVRFVIEKLRHVGILFGGKSFKELSERGWIYAKYVSEIESDSDHSNFDNTKHVFDDLNIPCYPDEDCSIVQYVCSLVSTRATTLASAGIAALLNKIGRPEVAVGVYGSLYRFHSYFHDLMEERVKQLVKPGVNFKLMLSHNGSGKELLLSLLLPTN